VAEGQDETMARLGDFYESDEPVEQLEAAFEQGVKAVSASKRAPELGWNKSITVTGVRPTPLSSLGKTRAATMR
jgi:hypothetical protein